MEDLKAKSVYQLLYDVDNILYFLSTHNKNYTKKQYLDIMFLVDYIEELKNRIL